MSDSADVRRRQAVLDDARRMRKIEQSIAVETRRIARLLRSSNDRLSSILHGYLEQTGRLVIPTRQWDEVNERCRTLEGERNVLRLELGSARCAEIARELEEEKSRERTATVSRN